MRPFRLENVSILTTSEAHFHLTSIELIVLGRERIMEVLDVPRWMKAFPGMDASLLLAGLEDHHQGVQSVDDFLERPLFTVDGNSCINWTLFRGKEVVYLSWIRLF